MRHKHRWWDKAVTEVWYRHLDYPCHDRIISCNCGMKRVDRIVGVVNQRKLWEWHYFPKVTQ